MNANYKDCLVDSSRVSSYTTSRKVAIDLFSGGGGLSQGLKQAGFAVCAAVEVEPHACATYLANHVETVLFQRDIRQISGVELLKLRQLE